jgi:hypothetical protein
MKCFECGEKATEKHHMVPKSLGGTKTIDLCSKCHCKVHGFHGNRINAVDLIKLGVYRKNVTSFVAVLAWNKLYVDNSFRDYDSKGRFDANVLRRNRYKSYICFSGDYKLSKPEFEKRLEVIGQWSKEKRWDWFFDISMTGGAEHVYTTVKTLNDKYRVKKYNKVNKEIHIPMLPQKGLIDKDNWRTRSWNFNIYDDQVMCNVVDNLDDRDSRFKFKREMHIGERVHLLEKQIERNLVIHDHIMLDAHKSRCTFKEARKKYIDNQIKLWQNEEQPNN